MEKANRVPPTRPSIMPLVWRALRKQCPACGRFPLFRGWFTMHEHCGNCRRAFRRDPGYLLGSIYFNYGVTAMIVVIAYFTIYFADLLTAAQALVVLAVFCGLFPLWFFRYARSLWIAFDEFFDPWPNSEEAQKLRAIARRSRFNG